TNNRTSTLSVVVSGNGAASRATKLTENRTEFIPVGEFELGLAWGRPLAARPADPAAVYPGAVLWVKAGLIADGWGSLGLLSAADNGQGFSDSNLFLFGFSVLAGLEF